jgi:2-dehydropantoate 2-reductase
MAPLLNAAIQEAVDVGIACGVDIGHEVIDKWQVFIRNAPAGMTPSMAVDLLAGNRLELNWLTGKIIELGRVHDMRTPVNSVIYAALKSFVNGKAAE